MTTSEAKTLRAGDLVSYGPIPRATVICVTKKGVRIGFDGRGLKDGEYEIVRAAARYLTRL